MTLREAIEKHCCDSFCPQSILDEAYDHFSADFDIDKEAERIQLKVVDTLRIVEQTIVDFQEALDDARMAEKEIIQPYIEGDTGVDIDMERLLSIEKKWLELTAALGADKDLYRIIAHTINAYDIWLGSELSFLKDIYTDKKTISMARVRKMKEWFAVVGSFLVCTRDVLNKAEKSVKSVKSA